MCQFLTSYHTTCKHYSRPQYTLCDLAAADPVIYSRGCHNTTDLGLQTAFSDCVSCQRTRARSLFFGGGACNAEPEPITYGIVASRPDSRVPSVCVTSAVDTASNSYAPYTFRRSSVTSSSSSSSSGGMCRSESTLSLDSMMSETTVASSYSAYSSSSSCSAGSYGGWSFRNGKFGNAHWRAYQADDAASMVSSSSSSSSSSMYTVQPSKQQQGRGKLKSILEI